MFVVNRFRAMVDTLRSMSIKHMMISSTFYVGSYDKRAFVDQWDIIVTGVTYEFSNTQLVIGSQRLW